MHQRLSQIGLIAAIALAGCSRDRPMPAPAPAPTPSASGGGKETPPIVKQGSPRPGGGNVPYTTPPDVPVTRFDVPVALPEQTRQERYEAALLEAIDHLAERKYSDALTALETAQKHQDTASVQLEIDKVRTILAQQAAAEKAVQDIKTVLEDGKPEDAARLAGSALAQYGGGDRADDLARLKQEAEAVVTAAADNPAARRAALGAEVDTALENRDLRAAAVALEQVLSLGDDPIRSKQLAEVRDKLGTYDDNRARAIELRKDPTHVEEAITRLKAAQEAWPTLQVRQEIDECTLILERRRDRLSVADLEVLGDVGVPAAGRAVAAELLTHFRPRFDLVERSQISRVMNELNLDPSDVGDSPQGRRELGRLARLRYLVVGSLSPIGGVTLQARLVEVPTGLIVQTARVSAPTVEALLPRLREAALVLQMNDDQKHAYERRLQTSVVAVRPIEATPFETLPPPPPPPAPSAPPPPAMLTYTPAPPPLGGLVVEDFQRLTPVVVTPPALGLVIQKDDPRRHRLFRLSLELGDDCFRRGQFRDAQRHFSLALSVGGPRRDVALRLDNCRGFVPPPPPPPVYVVPPPAIRPPSLLVPIPAAPVAPVVVVRQPIVARPRVAVFGFVINCRPGLVPPAASEVLADQFASYCGGSYQVLDRGEVCWYMGRLNLTMREVVNDPISRRCLAQALNARYFVFGSVQETASFNVQTHLVDPETGGRTGTGQIHVKDNEEMKLRLGELAQQIGAKPADQQALAKKGAASEKALTEARALLAKEPARAAEVARAALKDNPDSVALQKLVADADRNARQTQLEAERRKAAGEQAKAQADAKKRQESLAQQGAEARARAEGEAARRGAEAKKQQQAERARAAVSLQAQARQAQAKGDHARAVQLLQSASALQPSDTVFRELGQARVEAEKAAHDRAAAEQKKRDEALKAQRDAAAKRVQVEKAARDKVDAERHKVEETRLQTLHDGFLKQAKDQMAKKDYAKAAAAAESARRYRNTPESLRLLQDAQHAVALDEASKKGAAEKARVEAEQKKRHEAEEKLKKDREAYLAAIKKGQDALVAKRYDEAVSQYQLATKLFRDPPAVNGLKVAEDLRKQEQARLTAEKQGQIDAANRSMRMKALIDQGNKSLQARQYAASIDAFREALKLAPGNVDAAAGLSRAERERNEAAAQLARDKAMKDRQAAVAKHLAAGKANLSKNKPEAKKALQEVLRLDPGNAEAKTLLAGLDQPSPGTPSRDKMEDYKLALGAGRAAMKTKNYPGAIKSFDEAWDPLESTCRHASLSIL